MTHKKTHNKYIYIMDWGPRFGCVTTHLLDINSKYYHTNLQSNYFSTTEQLFLGNKLF